MGTEPARDLTLRHSSARPLSHPTVPYRTLEPTTFWAGQVRFEDGTTTDTAKEALKDVAARTGLAFSGFLSTDERTGQVTYEFTRYPRGRFGPVPPPSEFDAQLAKLGEALSARGFVISTRSVTPGAGEQMRMLLGLEEGYAEHKRRLFVEDNRERVDEMQGSDVESFRIKAAALYRDAGAEVPPMIVHSRSAREMLHHLEGESLGRVHTVQEVRRLSAGAFTASPVEILSVGSWGSYQEPAALLRGEPETLDSMLAIAHAFKQARVAIERIGRPEGSDAFMVELSGWCRDPDPK